MQAKGLTEEALIREDPRGWHPSRHPDNASGQDLVFWILRSMHAKNEIDAKRTSVPIFAYSVQRALDLKRAAVTRDAIHGTNMARFFSIIYY